MTPRAFEKLVASIGFAPVPERFRRLVENVALLIEDDVPEDVRRDLGLPDDETLLGLYQGIPRTERNDAYGRSGTLPDTITLFRMPILDAAEEDGVPVRKVIEETIWHEVAHHFGLSDRRVEAIEASRLESEPMSLSDYSIGIVPAFKAPDGGLLFCVVHLAAGHWGFPKGHPNVGEAPEATARRELYEETGIRGIDLVPGALVSEEYSFERTGGRYIKTVDYFLGFARDAKNDTPAEFKNEITECAWLPYDEAVARLTFPEAKKVLEDAAGALHSDARFEDCK